MFSPKGRDVHLTLGSTAAAAALNEGLSKPSQFSPFHDPMIDSSIGNQVIHSFLPGTDGGGGGERSVRREAWWNTGQLAGRWTDFVFWVALARKDGQARHEFGTYAHAQMDWQQSKGAALP